MTELKFFTDFDSDLKIIKEQYPELRKICKNFNEILKCYIPKCVNYNDKQILKYFIENKKSIQESNKNGYLFQIIFYL